MQQILANPLGALAQADEMMQGKRRARLADLQLQAAEKRQQLGTLLPKAMAGDQQATAQVAEIDPELFLKLDENQKAAVSQRSSQIASILAGIEQAPPPLRQAAYNDARARYAAMGGDLSSAPTTYDPAWVRNQYNSMRKVEDILKVQKARQYALSPGAQLRGSDGELLAENTNARPIAPQSDYYTVESTPQGLVQINSRVPGDVRPIMLDGKPVTRSQYDALLQQQINEGRAEGTATGKTKATHANQLKEWSAFQQAFATTYPDVGAIFEAAPGSTLSQAVNAYGSRVIGGTNQYEAQADIQQLGAILLQQVPFPPGAQTELEAKQREATMGLINDPNISPTKKLQMINRFLQINEQKFKALNAGQEEAPNGVVPPPPGQPATQQNMQPNTFRSSSGIQFTVEQ